MKTQIKLSRMDCYAGKQRAEVMAGDKDYFYLQFVEGCGYTVYEITPDEAIELGNILINFAKNREISVD